MIKISIDEGAAFDMLCIAQIKYQANPNSVATRIAAENIAKEIHDQIGYVRSSQVVQSDEFIELTKINFRIYDMINSVKIHEILGDATKIDQLNHERFLTKKKIQEKFFGSNLTEQKFGYKND